jgi:hypothetical protein
MRLFKIQIILLVVLAAGTVQARQTGFYIGGAVGNTSYEDDDRSRDIGLHLDDDDRGGQFFVGVDFTRFFALEANFADLGEFTDSTRTFTDSFEVATIFAVGKVPIGYGPVSLYGKAGLGAIYWEEDDTFLGTYWDDSSGVVAVGFGVAITPRGAEVVTFRLGWDFYLFTLEDDFPPYRDYHQSVGMGSLGLQVNF